MHVLDAFVQGALVDDPALRAEWDAVKRVPRSPRRTRRLAVVQLRPSHLAHFADSRLRSLFGAGPENAVSVGNDAEEFPFVSFDRKMARTMNCVTFAIGSSILTPVSSSPCDSPA